MTGPLSIHFKYLHSGLDYNCRSWVFKVPRQHTDHLLNNCMNLLAKHNGFVHIWQYTCIPYRCDVINCKRFFQYPCRDTEWRIYIQRFRHLEPTYILRAIKCAKQWCRQNDFCIQLEKNPIPTNIGVTQKYCWTSHNMINVRKKNNLKLY